MSNDYFNHTSTLTRLTRATAAAVNSIFSSVAAGFELLPALDDIKRSKVNYALSTGSADAYLADALEAATSYQTGMQVRVQFHATNTGASTLNVTGQGVRSIKTMDGADVLAGDLTAGDIHDLTYDGTNFVLVSPARSIFTGIAGNLTGDPTFSGNPTFSGDPTFSGNPDFSGAPTFDSLTASGSLHVDNVSAAYSMTISGTNMVLRDSDNSKDFFVVEQNPPANAIYVDASGVALGGTWSPSIATEIQFRGDTSVDGNAYVNDAILQMTAFGTETKTFNVGTGRTGSGESTMNIVGDTTYSTYGLQFSRDNGGANTDSTIKHRGTGALALAAEDAGSISFSTNGTTTMTVASDQKVGIGVTSPAADLVIYDGVQYPSMLFQDETTGTTSGDGLEVGYNVNAFIYNYENSNLTFGTNGLTSSLVLHKTSGATFFGTGLGVGTPIAQIEVEGGIGQRPLSADPSDPPTGRSILWISDGTGSGDAGDVMMKINVGGTTKTITLVDWSAS